MESRIVMKLYRRDGSDIEDPLELGLLWLDRSYQVVQQTRLPRSKKLISTVWVGIDYNFSGHGPPLIFETMCFHITADGFQSIENAQVFRWATETEARNGHWVICELWKYNRRQRRKQYMITKRT